MSQTQGATPERTAELLAEVDDTAGQIRAMAADGAVGVLEGDPQHASLDINVE
jgi:hypothetical protein